MKLEWRDAPTMNPRNTKPLRRLIERRTGIRHWGKLRFVTPRLCSTVFGDGRKLIALYPVMFRPHHFVVRIDSSWSTSNWDHGEHTPQHWLDDVYDAIEDEFVEWPWARAYGLRWPKNDGDERSSRIDFIDGSCWGEMQWPREIFQTRRRAA